MNIRGIIAGWAMIFIGGLIFLFLGVQGAGSFQVGLWVFLVFFVVGLALIFRGMTARGKGPR